MSPNYRGKQPPVITLVMGRSAGAPLGWGGLVRGGGGGTEPWLCVGPCTSVPGGGEVWIRRLKGPAPVGSIPQGPPGTWLVPARLQEL